MNPVDAVELQRIKAMIEVDDESSENFKMDILLEGTLDKALMVTEKYRY